MPGMGWKEVCIQESGGQRNMKCMTWHAGKEKVINVICVLKCEAKKTAAAGEAASNLREIRVSRPFLHRNFFSKGLERF